MKNKKAVTAFVLAIVLLSTGVASVAASIVRNIFIHTLTTATTISNTRRDSEMVRIALTNQLHALMRYNRTMHTDDLSAFESDTFDNAIALVRIDVQRSGAIAENGQLSRALAYHDAWMKRMERIFAQDPRAMVPPINNTDSIKRHLILTLLADMERTSIFIDEQLSEIDAILDNQEAALNSAIAAQLPADVAIFAFIAVALAVSGMTAFLNSHRFALERQRSSRLAQAFGNAALPRSPHVVLDGILAPVSQADMVGGDWYDARMLSDGRMFLTVGDVTGHGIEAAMTMMQVRQALLGAAIGQLDPASVLYYVNREHAMSDLLHVSAICAYYDPCTRLLRYASAGFPAPLIREGHETRLLSYGGPPLGVDGDFRYESHREILKPGAAVALYTDGLIENEHDSSRGEMVLQRLANHMALDHFAHRLYRALFSSRKQHDDVAILTLHASSS